MSKVKAYDPEYTLPEQRFRVALRSGGRGITHVALYRTFEAGNSPGYWTRRAADVNNLCGSMRYCVVGVDAEGWSSIRYPIDTFGLNCARCIKSYASWLKRQGLTW